MTKIYTFLLMLLPFCVFAQEQNENESYPDYFESESVLFDDSDSVSVVMRDGVHLGLSLIPSYGRQSNEYSFVNIIGIDLDIFFTCNTGLRTGLRYIKTNITFYQNGVWLDSLPNSYYTDAIVQGTQQGIGIPIKYSYNTKKKVGLYVECGIVAYLLEYIDAKADYPEFNESQNIEARGVNLTWDFEAAFGLNWRLNDEAKIKLGTTAALTPFSRKENVEYFIGLQMGFSYKIAK